MESKIPQTAPRGPKLSTQPRRAAPARQRSSKQPLTLTTIKAAFEPYVSKRGSRKLSLKEEDELKAEMSGISGLLTSPNAVYTFRLTNYGALSSSAGGTFLTHVSCDISGSVEFSSYLANMFTECRLRSSRLTLLPSCIAVNAGNNYPCMLVGTDQVHYNFNPTSAQTVADLADSRLVPTVNVDMGAPRKNYMYDAQYSEFKWASCATPTADVAAGLVAQYSVAATDSAPASQIMAYYLIEVVVEFRNRS